MAGCLLDPRGSTTSVLGIAATDLFCAGDGDGDGVNRLIRMSAGGGAIMRHLLARPRR